MSNKCNDCKFYDGDEIKGKCVIDPPKLLNGASGHSPEHYYQPKVYSDGRCGKFEQPMTAVERYIRDKALDKSLNRCQPMDGQQPKPKSEKTTKKPRGRNRGSK